MHEQMRGSRWTLFAGAILLVALGLSAAPVGAHHGWSGYLQEEFEMSGVVDTAMAGTGPHSSMRVKAQGQVWDLVLAPPARTEQAGLKVGVIPVGAQVTIHGHRHRDPKKFEIKTERITWNGRTFNVYPDRN
jgi:hypothetical protein